MKAYCLEGLMPEEVQKIKDAGVYVLPVYLGEDPKVGIAFDVCLLPRIEQILGKKFTEEPTKYEEIFLLREDHERSEMEEFTVTIEKWNGANSERFIDAAKRILLPVVRKNIIINVPHGVFHAPVENDNFYIWVWSHPNAIEKLLPRQPETMWGINVDCRDSGFTPCLWGDVILCNDGAHAAAELIGSNLYIFHDIVHFGSENEEYIFCNILEECCKILQRTPRDEKGLKEAREKKLQEAKEKFISVCKKCSASLISKLEEEITACKSQLINLQQEIVKKIRLINTNVLQIENMKSHADNKGGVYLKEFEKLCQVEKIIHFDIMGNVIDIYTDTLYCQNPNTRQFHEIGRFNIKIFMNGENGCVCFNNQTRRIEGFKKGMHAPHIMPEGLACLGNIAGAFPELIARQEYATCAFLAIQFIESVNINDPAGLHLNKWPVAEKPIKK